MASRITTALTAGALLLAADAFVKADTIQLVNGDRIKGKVAALDDKQVVLKSETFGELKIPREKVELISLGDKGIPDLKAVVVPEAAGAPTGQPLNNLNNISPLLQDPAVQQQLGPMIQQLLGPNGGRDSQQNIDKARQGLHDLRKDFGDEPEGKALDAYIRFFEQIAPAASLGSQKATPPPPTQGRRVPRGRPAERKKAAERVKPAGADKPAESKAAEDPKKDDPKQVDSKKDESKKPAGEPSAKP